MRKNFLKKFGNILIFGLLLCLALSLVGCGGKDDLNKGTIYLTVGDLKVEAKHDGQLYKLYNNITLTDPHGESRDEKGFVFTKADGVSAMGFTIKDLEPGDWKIELKTTYGPDTAGALVYGKVEKTATVRMGLTTFVDIDLRNNEEPADSDTK